ncbi:MAG TPA: PAS domain-containing protein [Candidatus Dormibacteraeota bacterium]|nr:PAS domain-containing protein [Candidatus Dormibacteraeota bacterium]
MLDPDLYTIGEVAAILGVSAHTIRAWERRHGIVHPQRTRTKQRRYRGEDVELLRDVKRSIDLKGLSLKLAFQAASGGPQPVESRTSRTRPKRSEKWPLPGDAGVWQAVADVLTQLIMVIDPDGKIREANVAVAKILGTLRQKVAGNSFVDLVDPFDRSKAVLLYRPQLRTAKGWELNITTRSGPRLYQFECWPVRQGGETLLAVVGTEMFSTSRPRSIDIGGAELPGTGPIAGGDPRRDLTTMHAFQSLIDQLPLGVAVTTIGPRPRVVYANQRLFQSLGVAPAVLTGRPFSELVPDEAVVRTLKEVVATRTYQTLRGVSQGGPGAAARQRFLNLGFRPLLSSNRKVTSVLIVVEDATAEVSASAELEKLVADQRFERATTAQQLARVGLEHLVTLVSGVDFAIALANRANAGGELSILSMTPGWRTSAGELARGPVGTAIGRAVDGGIPVEIRMASGSQSFDVTAIPLMPSDGFGTEHKLGAIAWRRPPADPLGLAQRHAIDYFLPRLAVATEILQLRAEAARKAARLEAVVAATSVVRNPGDQTGFGFRFLKRLAEALGADGAAIGRVEGSDFVLEEAYAPRGASAKPGDRFPVSGHFVSESVRTGEPTATSHLSTEGLPRTIKKALTPMRHALSVPLMLDGQVKGVIALLRTSETPFDQEDVVLVQTVSSVALLAVTLSRRDRSPF